MDDRRRRSLRRSKRQAGVVLVLVLAGVLFAANARISGGVNGRQPQDLAQLVEVEMARAAVLEAEVNQLGREIDRLTDARIVTDPAAEAEAEELALAVGRRAVVGPGLTVRLTDASGSAPRPDWVTNDDLVVHQQDVQAVINALWAGGAEAMTLQDQRVISTSAFRCIGNVLLLHGQHYSPPYVVRAIGDPERLTAALEASPDIRTYRGYVAAVGLGWSVTSEQQLELPAYSGNLELTFASVPKSEDATGSAP